MFLIAGVVMWTKAAYLGRVSKANRAFNEAYRRLGANIAGLKSSPEGQDPVVQASPLFAVYEAGLGELNEMRRISGGGSMSGEAIEAVRSSVDAVQVEQNQKLDAWMVLLTIAISGGPFIGLLGTVLGVMITFAAVAAAGDVNVNAIAPGIAAALLATVAGLAVAIPALFAYNYFNARISALSDQMRVFADRLITRLAEAQARNALPAAE
jgi:biopolymer transport protein ExbB